MENPVHIDSRRRFAEAFGCKLGPQVITTDFDQSYISPEFEKYSNDDNKDGSPARMLETPAIESQCGDHATTRGIN